MSRSDFGKEPAGQDAAVAPTAAAAETKKKRKQRLVLMEETTPPPTAAPTQATKPVRKPASKPGTATQITKSREGAVVVLESDEAKTNPQGRSAASKATRGQGQSASGIATDAKARKASSATKGSTSTTTTTTKRGKRGLKGGKVEDGSAGIVQQINGRSHKTEDKKEEEHATRAPPAKTKSRDNGRAPSAPRLVTGEVAVEASTPPKAAASTVVVGKHAPTTKASTTKASRGKATSKEDDASVGDTATTTSETFTGDKARARTTGKGPTTSRKKGTGSVSTNESRETVRPVQSKISDHFFVRRSSRISEKPKSGGAKITSTNDRLVAELLAGGQLDKMESFDAKVKGLGVRATAAIKTNKVVCEYNGDLLDFDEALKVEEKYQKNPEIGCYMYFFFFKNKKYCVDATYAKGLGRLINHSKKKANLKTRLLDHDGVPRLVLISIADISVGDELVYDYGDRRKSATVSNGWLDE